MVVALDDVSDEEIRSAIETRKELADVSVLVVAPASHVGRLQWLTGDVDEARAEAGEVADRAAGAVDADVETEIGDRDPVLAVEDALATFPADEIIVAGSDDAETEAALRRFGVPVSRLDGGGEGTAEEAVATDSLAREVAEGRSPETPVVLLGTVGAVLVAAIVLLSLLVFLAVWLT